MNLVRGQVTFYTLSALSPLLEVEIDGETETVEFHRSERRRFRGDIAWVAEPQVPAFGAWRFRINLGHETYAAPAHTTSYDPFVSPVQRVWVQHGELFAYEPAPFLTLSRVLKIPYFSGSLSRRPLYVYLPRGYDQHSERSYPVIYMHDGQNCFEAFHHDSYAGSWRADLTADRLIAGGQMRECIIVGVGNGGTRRLAEYLPPYSRFQPPADDHAAAFRPIRGLANETAEFYMEEVAPFVQRHFRVIPHRDATATVGSSMGGLFSTYLAWEYPEFARHHAAMSPSYWITGDPAQAFAEMEVVRRLECDTPRDVRLWLDSGTLYAAERGDDGKAATIAARDALLHNGYVLGENLGYFLHEGAMHTEAAWAERLPRVFRFLFPLQHEE